MNGLFLPFAAVAAGIVSVTSPCVLPVLPGYIATVASSDGEDHHHKARSRIAGAVGFVAGFTIVFTALGATASAVGELLYERLEVVLRIAGVLLIVMGLHASGALRVPFLWRERRPVALERLGGGPRRSVALGAAFAFGWTPCVGPILATVLTKAAARTSVTEGMALLALYSLGLGLPFIGVAAWFDRSERPRRWMMRRALVLQRVGGATMTVVGIGYLSGTWMTLFTGAQSWLARTGWPPI